MTIIEFFDKTAIENIAGALLCKPEKVVFVGHDSRPMWDSIAVYREVLAKKGINVEFPKPVQIDRHELGSIVNKLSEIVENNSDCIFDLTGGEDLYLVAVGIVMEKYKGRVQCHRFNFSDDSLIDCDMDGGVCRTESFDISVEDNISIYGGKILTDPTLDKYTYPWDFSIDFIDDVEQMWEICAHNPSEWNAHISTIGDICERFDMPSPLDISFNVTVAERTLRRDGERYAFIQSIMYDLCSRGLVSRLQVGEKISFRFKNEQVKKCLTVAGQILELKTALVLRSIEDSEGEPLYHDVRVGVVIDWSANAPEREFRSINEIDIIAMKGMIPVFISCKNGKFEADELFKLNTVASRFGDKYVKKVLVTTEIDKLGDKGDHLRARADDMGIRRVEDVDRKSDCSLRRVYRSL